MRAADQRAESERIIRARIAKGDAAGAADALWRAYGAELHGWLVAGYGHVDASDIASSVQLALCRAVLGFRGDATARTWLYQIARRAVVHHHRAERRRRALFTPLAHHPSAERRRPSRGSSTGGLVERLRASLSPDERALLSLRYDRELSYAELARVFFDADDPADVERGAARLRQRIRAIKARLVRERGRDAG